jgi:hypothetical protein
MKTELGKIQRVHFGFGGYQDAMFGVSFTLAGEGWSVGNFRGTWATHGAHCKWTPQDQSDEWGKTVSYCRDLCESAKVQTVDQLCGIPIEAKFDQNTLKSWRILSEVL